MGNHIPSLPALTTTSLMLPHHNRGGQPSPPTNQRYGSLNGQPCPSSPLGYLNPLLASQTQEQSLQQPKDQSQYESHSVRQRIIHRGSITKSDPSLTRQLPPKLSPFATQACHGSEESLSFGKSSLGQAGFSIENEESSLSFGSRPLSQRSRSQSRSRSNTRAVRLASPNHYSTHSSLISSVSWTVPGPPPTIPRAPSSSPMTRRNPIQPFCEGELQLNGLLHEIGGVDTEAERRWLEHFCGGNWNKYRKQMKDKQPHSCDTKNDVVNIPFYFQSSEPGTAIREDEMNRLNGTVIIQRYLILESLGLGTCAVVYSAIDQSTGDRVALKISKTSKDAFDQLLHEIHILDRLHKRTNTLTSSIPQIRDQFYWKGHLIAVFPLYGLDVYQLMLRELTTKKVEMVIEVSKEMLSILNEMHSEGIVHCDIKPENIVRDRQKTGTYYLIDFGLARLECEATSYYIQTRSYRAPELLLHLPYNSKIDIWAFGCVLVEIWTGKVLMKGGSESEVLQNVVRKFGNPSHYLLKHSPIDLKNLRNSPPVRNPKAFLDTLGMPSVMIDFMSKLLMWDPLIRWSAEELLKHELLKFPPWLNASTPEDVFTAYP